MHLSNWERDSDYYENENECSYCLKKDNDLNSLKSFVRSFVEHLQSNEKLDHLDLYFYLSEIEDICGLDSKKPLNICRSGV